jgi:hypothetical protein
MVVGGPTSNSCHERGSFPIIARVPESAGKQRARLMVGAGELAVQPFGRLP